MSPVLTRPRPRPAQVLLRRDVLVLVVLGVLVITTLAGAHVALRGRRFVDRITIVNETPYLIEIEVTGNTRDGWLRLGPVSPGGSHDFGTVVDQGGDWIFHVTAGPSDGGEISLSRSELEQGTGR